MEEPRVTIIVPTYKRPHLLEGALGSVLRQTYPHWEVVVIDDNGDGTPGREKTEVFMRRYDDEPRIRYVKHERNRGLPAARNTAARASRAELVAFLDDDDAWLPEKLERQVALFDEHEDVVLVYTGIRVVNDSGELRKTVRPNPKGLERENLLEENYVHTPSSVMVRRSALEAAGGFDESLPSFEDWDFYLRVRSHGRFAFVDEFLTEYAWHDSGGGQMMQNHPVLARAYALMYEKHGPELERNPKRHAKFLHRHARTLMLAGDLQASRVKVRRSLRLHPFDRSAGRLFLQLHLGMERFEAIRSRTEGIRGRFGRSRQA